MEKVLIGYDGSEYSKRALQFVIGISDDYETEIRIAFIVQGPCGMSDPIPDEVLESIQRRGQESLLEADRLVRKYFRKPITYLSVGNPAEKLIDLADKLEPRLVVL